MSIEHLNQTLKDQERLASLKKRFASKVKVGQESECWPWTAKAVASYGYGRMTAGRGKYLRAHQVAWALAYGPIPDGAVVRHSCDNPSCCNPAHLSLGAQKDNVADAIARGRNSPPPRRVGADHPMAKLSAGQVAEIRKAEGTLEQAAKRFGMSTKTIWRIRKGIQWKEFEPP